MNERLRALGAGRVESVCNGVPLDGLRAPSSRVFLRCSRPYQARDRMSLPLQRFDKRRSQESRRPRNQNAHVPGLPALIHTLRRGRWQGQMNFGNVRFISYVNFETVSDLEEPRGESQERWLELKQCRQVPGATVVGWLPRSPFIGRNPRGASRGLRDLAME